MDREKEARLSKNPLKYYWPHAYGCDGHSCQENRHTHTDYFGTEYTLEGCPQFAFHTSLISDRADLGGNRSGKTTCGIVEDAFHSTGYYPDWYPKERRLLKANVGRIFARDFRVVGEVITKDINTWFPKDAIIDKDKNNAGVWTKYYIKHESGGISAFDIMTYEMEASQCESWSGHWAHYDEPPPRTHRVATARGLTDFRGREWFTLTPLAEPWIFDEIWMNDDVFSITCDIRHNLRRFNPISKLMIGLTSLAITDFEKKLQPDEVEARSHGKFMYLAGRVYKKWNRTVHTFNRYEMWKKGERGVTMDGQPPPHWDRIMLIDPHDRQNHALLWVAREPDYGLLYGYREAWIPGIFAEAVRHIRDEEMKFRDRVQMRIMDPNFGPKMQGNSGKTVRQEFEHEANRANYPMRFAFGDDRNAPAGRKAVAELMTYDSKEVVSIVNRPLLYMASDLKECIYQVEHYIWDEYKYGERDPKEKVKDMNTHFPDLLRYLALFDWASMYAEIVQGEGSLYGT